jgi:hypothetical protein
MSPSKLSKADNKVQNVCAMLSLMFVMLIGNSKKISVTCFGPFYSISKA